MGSRPAGTRSSPHCAGLVFLHQPAQSDRRPRPHGDGTPPVDALRLRLLQRMPRRQRHLNRAGLRRLQPRRQQSAPEVHEAGQYRAAAAAT